jgi:hypothetical protein
VVGQGTISPLSLGGGGVVGVLVSSQALIVGFEEFVSSCAGSPPRMPPVPLVRAKMNTATSAVITPRTISAMIQPLFWAVPGDCAMGAGADSGLVVVCLDQALPSQYRYLPLAPPGSGYHPVFAMPAA